MNILWGGGGVGELSLVRLILHIWIGVGITSVYSWENSSIVHFLSVPFMVYIICIDPVNVSIGLMATYISIQKIVC